MPAKPNVLVGLDDNTVVVGYHESSPLRVWDLAAGRCVRAFEGSGQYCYSMISISGGRIAAGWYAGGHVVAIFDVATGKRLQSLGLGDFGSYIFGLAFVEDHLLTMSQDHTLRVWSQPYVGKVRRHCEGKGGADAGFVREQVYHHSLVRDDLTLSLAARLDPPIARSQFTQKAKFVTRYAPVGAMTVLSQSRVALSMCYPGQIEIWDWRQGKCLGALSMGAGACYVFAHALLPDGRLVAGDWAGAVRIGSPDNWTSATTIASSSGLTGVLACKDGSFLTTEKDGKIKLWRNGACEVTLTGSFSANSYYGVPLAVVCRKLVFAGLNRTLLVAE